MLCSRTETNENSKIFQVGPGTVPPSVVVVEAVVVSTVVVDDVVAFGSVVVVVVFKTSVHDTEIYPREMATVQQKVFCAPRVVCSLKVWGSPKRELHVAEEVPWQRPSPLQRTTSALTLDPRNHMNGRICNTQAFSFSSPF